MAARSDAAAIVDGPPLDNRIRVSDIGHTGAAGNTVYYRGTTSAEGAELWCTDGTYGGTYLVKDILPGPESSEPSSVVFLNNVVFFAASDGINGPEIWRSDGTAAGTYLLKDVCPGGQGSDPNNFIVMSDYVLFAANDGVNGRELWRTDGTAEGTSLLYDISTTWTGGEPGTFTRVGDLCFFEAHPAAIMNANLYVTDGTAAGTRLLLTLPYGNDMENYRAVGNILYFSYGDGIWKSDGTVAGTSFVKDLWFDDWGAYLDNFVSCRGKLYFSAKDENLGMEIWSSDGTEAGTQVAVDLAAGPDSSWPNHLCVYNDNIYFMKAVYELWKTDGTSGGTVKLKQFPNPGYSPFDPLLTVANGRLFGLAPYTGGIGQLWQSDGTVAGTVTVKTIGMDTGSLRPGNLTSCGTKLFFKAQQLDAPIVYAPDLMVSNGTSAGTYAPRPNGGYGPVIWNLPEIVAVLNGSIFFRETSTTSGYELWRTEGATASAVLVKEIWAGEFSSFPRVAAVNGRLYVEAVESAVGSEPWISDGTAGGTMLLKDINPGVSSSLDLSQNAAEFTPVGDTVFFVANDGVHGPELWKTDGTESGTSMVKDINPNQGDTYNQPRNLIVFGGQLYFSTLNQLWKTDGTEAGTVTVSSVSTSGPFVEMLARLYFFGGDGLCQSDGTSEGTALVKPLPGNIGQPSPGNLLVVGDRLFFTAASPEAGNELWSSDGTEVGTHLVADIVAGIGDSNPDELTDLEGTLCFTADDKVYGRELWRSDGTVGGTVMVKDIFPGLQSSKAKCLFVASTSIGNILLFAAAADSGVELWCSNGTETGTHLLVDIAAGTGSSNPDVLACLDDNIYFRADDGFHGNRVWLLNPLALDIDGDGLSSADEARDLDPGTPGLQNPFDPFVADSTGDDFSDAPDGVSDGENDYDGDGVNNMTEIRWGSNPADPASYVTLPAASVLALVILSSFSLGLGILYHRGVKRKKDYRQGRVA